MMFFCHSIALKGLRVSKKCDLCEEEEGRWVGKSGPCRNKMLPVEGEHIVVLFKPSRNTSVLSLLFEMETSQLPHVVLGLKNGSQGHVTSGFKGQGSDSPDAPSPP